MRASLRIGFVGAGSVVVKYHAPAVRGVPEVSPVMVVDANVERARDFAGRYCVPRWGTKIRDLLGNVDIAVIALPNHLHADVACELLDAGIHVLCEVPMARNVAECRRMIQAADRSKAVLCIGHNRRFRPHVAFARGLIAGGQIGSVTAVQAEEGSRGDWPRSAFYSDPVQAGGGALIEVGIHGIDLIRWLVGDFEHLEYTAKETASGVESEADVGFHLRNGARGKLIVSRTRQLAQRLTVAGDEGSLEIGLRDTSLRMRSRRGKVFNCVPSLDLAVAHRTTDASFVDQLVNLVSAISGRGELLVDGREGMAAVDVVSRAYGYEVSAPDHDSRPS